MSVESFFLINDLLDHQQLLLPMFPIVFTSHFRICASIPYNFVQPFHFPDFLFGFYRFFYFPSEQVSHK